MPEFVLDANITMWPELVQRCQNWPKIPFETIQDK